MSILKSTLFLFLILTYNANFIYSQNYKESKMLNEVKSRFAGKIQSSAFKEGEKIPSKFTCDGENVSPHLSWSDFPNGTKTFALIVDDPDAPGGIFVHWVVYNIPSNVTSLPEGTTFQNLPKGANQGTNHFGDNDYGGPCPPSGTHRYYFKLYALDSEVQLKTGAGKRDLLIAMEGHILAEAQLMGKYERQR
jgi:Raf kinase inhibitor-like YbhB/YbcL family protein